MITKVVCEKVEWVVVELRVLTVCTGSVLLLHCERKSMVTVHLVLTHTVVWVFSS